MSRHKSRKAETRKALAEREHKRAAIRKKIVGESRLAEVARANDAMSECGNEIAETLKRLYFVTGAEVYLHALADLIVRGYGGPDWRAAVEADLGVWADPMLGKALEMMDRLIDSNQLSERAAADYVAASFFKPKRGNATLESTADYLRTAYRQHPGPDRWPGRAKAAPGMEPPGRFTADAKGLAHLKELCEAHGVDLFAELADAANRTRAEYEKASVAAQDPLVLKVKR